MTTVFGSFLAMFVLENVRRNIQRKAIVGLLRLIGRSGTRKHGVTYEHVRNRG